MVKKVKKLKKLTKKINKLKEFDGETMEYIINYLGMRDQMLRQLMMSCDSTDVHNLYDERFGSDRNSEDLQHRFNMILDDANQIRLFITDKLGNVDDIPTRTADDVWTHFSNIEIASDLSSDECLGWVKFSNMEI